MKKLIGIIVTILLTSSLLVVPSGAKEFTGVLNGAPYKILVPDKNWNGVLLLYAHWYYRPWEFLPVAKAAHTPELEAFLLGKGYALAGSNFRGTGYQVKDGTHDLVALSGLFNGLVGKPKRRILMGYSVGSLIALKSAEEVPLYDGIISMCSIGGGTAFDRDVAFAYAYATVFGWPPEWGPWYDAREGLNFDRDVYPILLEQILILGNPNDPRWPDTFGRFEFIRILLDMPFDGFYQPPSGSLDTRPGAGFLMYATTEVKAEFEEKAKGYIYENAGRVYGTYMSPQDKGYLAFFGIDADQLLDQMNNGATVSAAIPQKHYGQKYFSPTGYLIMPVLSVHSKYDHMYPTYIENTLLEKVQSASSEELLVQVYTNDIGHCFFTNDQTLSAVKAMENWLNTGQTPDPANDTLFPPAQGFDPNHVPDPFPIVRE